MLKAKLQSLKAKLQSLIKPKFLGMSIIILIILCISLYILKEKERDLRIYTEKELKKTVEEKEVVKNNLNQTLKAKEVVEKELIAAKERSSVLEKELSDEKERSLALEREVKDREEEIRLTLNKLEKETVSRLQVEAQLALAIKENKTLEAKIEELAAVSKNVELEKIVIKPIPQISGKVLMMDKEHKFIVVDLGRRDNLKIGDILSIYRNGAFIGKVQVERLEEKNSAAAILPDWQDVELEVNDEVKGI